VTPSIRLIATPGHTKGHQSVAVGLPGVTAVVLAGQACYTAGEWAGEPDELEGRSGAPDKVAYDASIARLRELDPAAVYFAHDRATWTAGPRTPAILPGPC
jgi:glyoxylase-like metal-dependent hydrolase (beta-lactamase superfamily II)